MELSENKVLITGGSSGIGLELSRRLLEKDNKVLICGRSAQKLKAAHKLFPKLEIFQCDLSDKQQCKKLTEWIKSNHPDLNLLINNAALVHQANFFETDDFLEKAELEVQTNFLAPVRLIKYLYPVLKKNTEAAIINVTTGLVYAPKAAYPLYNATKAALHSFTQVLRLQQKNSTPKIIEVMFPAVDTPFHKGNTPKIAITTEKAVNEMLTGIQNDKDEIRIAGVKLLYKLTRMAPKFALQKINNL
jgi:uncharacterized oxidoreductase